MMLATHAVKKNSKKKKTNGANANGGGGKGNHLLSATPMELVHA
jgi:hypothetical protein